MAPSEDHLRRWQDRRAGRLRQLSWLRTHQPVGGPAVYYVADELLVVDDHSGAAERLLSAQVPASAISEAEPTAGLRRYRARDLDVAKAVRQLRRDAHAEGDFGPVASPNHVFVSAPFEHGGPFGPPVPATRPRALLDRATDRRPAEVAVLDTGVWRASPLPAGRYDADAADFESDVDVDHDGIMDGDVGHANFIAGVIVRRTGKAHMRMLRVLDTFGVCTEADLITALGRLGDEELVNLSLGGYTLDDQPPLAMRAALEGILAGKDRVVVAAAGNDGQRGRAFWPAAFAGAGEAWSDQVVAVAAHDGSNICHWSNTGDWITLAAPGAEVTSTYVRHAAFPSGWAVWSGTSFATPYVVAAVAEEFAQTGSAVSALRKVLADTTLTYDDYPGLS